MIYKPYSIVVVPFPFTDVEKAKHRPVLVLSSEEHQKETQHITLLMITTAKNSSWNSDCPITILKGTGLSVASVIRQKIFSLDIRLIKKSIGQLSEKDKKIFIKILKKHISL